jgi:hypothetical protein
LGELEKEEILDALSGLIAGVPNVTHRQVEVTKLDNNRRCIFLKMVLADSFTTARLWNDDVLPIANAREILLPHLLRIFQFPLLLRTKAKQPLYLSI